MASNSVGQLSKDSLEVDFTNIIEVIVGPSKQSFHVHTDLITRRSSFFKAAVAKHWNQSAKVCDHIELPDDEPGVFSDYLQLLYGFARLPRAGELGFRWFIHTYILADKLGDLTTANALIDGIIAHSDNIDAIPSDSDIQWVYEWSTEGSPLRSLMVDYYIFEANEKIYENDIANMPADFLAACMRRFRKLKQVEHGPGGDTSVDATFRPTISELDRCQYHHHNDDHPQCAKRQKKDNQSR